MPVDHLTAIPIIAEHIQQNMDLALAVADTDFENPKFIPFREDQKELGADYA